MNKALFPNGGVSLEGDDFRFIDTAVREAFTGLAKIFGDSFIISGVELVSAGGTLFDFTAGYLVLNGEVMKVDASPSPIDLAANPYLYVEEVVSYDPDGLETFENATTGNTYEIRRGRLVGYVTPQAGVAYLTIKRAEQIINDMTEDYTHDYTKRQSLAFAGDSVAANSNSLVLSSTDGNLFNVNIDACVVAKNRVSVTMPNGTVIVVAFTATAGNSVKIADGGAVAQRIRTAGGRTYIFQDGEAAIFAVRDDMYWLVNQPLNAIQTDGAVKLRTKVIEIGDWDMVASITKNVLHGISDHKKIRELSVVIRDDSDAAYNDLSMMLGGTFAIQGGINALTSTNVVLIRLTGGFFDATTFNATSYNRGWLTVTYEE